MKKFFLALSLLLLLLTPLLANAALVSCQNNCTLQDLFDTIIKIYNFLVLVIALPLAGLFIVIGGVMLLVSAGNPSSVQKGKDMIKVTIIAILIIFGSWLIVDSLLTAIGYVPQSGSSWWSF